MTTRDNRSLGLGNIRIGSDAQGQARRAAEEARLKEIRLAEEEEREWRRQEQARLEAEQKKIEEGRIILAEVDRRLATFTCERYDRLWLNATTNEVALRYKIIYTDPDKLWDFYKKHKREFEAFIRQEIAKLSNELQIKLQVKEIYAARGSIILTIIAAASLIVSAVAAYPAAKQLYNDLKPAAEKLYNALLAAFIKWFLDNGGFEGPGFDLY